MAPSPSDEQLKSLSRQLAACFDGALDFSRPDAVNAAAGQLDGLLSALLLLDAPSLARLIAQLPPDQPPPRR